MKPIKYFVAFLGTFIGLWFCGYIVYCFMIV